jgi:hypothetical protein
VNRAIASLDATDGVENGCLDNRHDPSHKKHRRAFRTSRLEHNFVPAVDLSAMVA